MTKNQTWREWKARDFEFRNTGISAGDAFLAGLNLGLDMAQSLASDHGQWALATLIRGMGKAEVDKEGNRIDGLDREVRPE